MIMSFAREALKSLMVERNRKRVKITAMTTMMMKMNQQAPVKIHHQTTNRRAKKVHMGRSSLAARPLNPNTIKMGAVTMVGQFVIRIDMNILMEHITR